MEDAAKPTRARRLVGLAVAASRGFVLASAGLTIVRARQR
jgi:hypothetical protein